MAERTGLTRRTLRFYEEKGLLDPPTRMEGGFRLYSEEDVQCIEHIVRLKRLLGVSLADIKQMVDAEAVLQEIRAQYRQESDAAAKLERVRDVIRVVETQAALIDQKIEQLQQVQARWQERLKHYREHNREIMHDLEAPLPAMTR